MFKPSIGSEEFADMVSPAISALIAGEYTEPIEFRVTTLPTLAQLAKVAFAAIGASRAEQSIDHEASHQVAAKALGATVNFFSVFFHPPSPDASWGTCVAVQTTINLSLPVTLTALERAAIFGYPVIPSDSDMKAIADLGYDIESLADEARYLNARGKLYVPVPLSTIPEAKDVAASRRFLK